MTVELVLFLLFGFIAVGAAVLMLLSENAIHSALFLIVNFACVAFMYLLLDAPFLTMIQVAVYAGAIMVLFLFVIMLLGAEQTSDTTRSFRWISGITVALAVALLLIVGAPLAAGNFTLPSPVPGQPLLRVVHAVSDAKLNFEDADAGNNSIQPQNLNVILDGQTLTTDFNFSFEDVVDYVEINPGEHKIGFTTLLDGVESPTIVNQGIDVDFTVAEGEIVTVVVTGEDIRSLSLYFASDDLSAVTEEDRAARLEVLNVFSEEPLMLVDLGSNKVLDTRDNPDGTTRILDNILVASAEYGVESATTAYVEGTYDLAFINSANEIVREFPEYEIERDTTKLLVLGKETQLDGNFRSLLVADDDLTVDARASFGGPHALGQLLFTTYMLPVQIVGVLLLVALVGVIVLTKPTDEVRERRQRGREKVSRPLISVISSQTGRDVMQGTAQLEDPSKSAGD